MSSDVESRLRSEYGHLVPEAACEADLVAALSTAAQERAPTRGAWVRRLVVPLAASLLVAGAWWWGSRATSDREAPAGPGDETAAPPTIAVRIGADGMARVTTHEASGGGSEKRIAVAGAALAELEGKLGASLGADAGFKEIAKEAAGVAFAAPRAANGTSTARLVVGGDATAQWRWIAWTLMAALPAQIVDVVFTSPADPKVTIAQPLPRDAGLSQERGQTVTWRVALILAIDSSCDDVASKGVDIEVHAGSKDLVEFGAIGVGGLATSGVAYQSRDEVRLADDRLRRHRRTLEVLAAHGREVVERAKADGASVVGEIAAPPPRGACVPYGAVFDVLSTLKAAGIETVHFAGSAPPTRAEPSASPTAPAFPLPPAVPSVPGPPRLSIAGLDEKRLRGIVFDDTPLESVVTYLRTSSGLSFFITPTATSLGVKVRLKLLEDVTVRQALDLVTLPNALTWYVADGVVWIAAHDEPKPAGR